MRPLICLPFLLTACADVPAGPRAPAHATIPPADTTPLRYDGPFGLVDAAGRYFTIVFALQAAGVLASHSRDHDAFASTSDSAGSRIVTVRLEGGRTFTLVRPAYKARHHPSDRLLLRCDGAAAGYMRAASALIDAAAAAAHPLSRQSRRALASAAMVFDDAWQRWRYC